MNRHEPQRLYRVELIDESDQRQHFYLWAPNADMAADEAERQTGSDVVLIDDCTPRKQRVAA